MTTWTPEQKQAIEKSGSNIIVSAGAGSGKTAVLSERVINKLQNGIHVNELLILTFTKAAAAEMKDRIRKKISKIKEFNEELNLLNSSYITTFDSYALSVLKKYHYLLNLSSDISITDESLVLLEENKIIDEIFEELYNQNDIIFENFIKDYCVKSDKILRKNILKIANKINDKINKYEYLDFIENSFYEEDYISLLIEEYKKFLNDKKRVILLELDNLNYYFDSQIVDKVSESVLPLLNASIDELHLFTSVNLPRFKYPTEESKSIKAHFKDLLDEYISYGTFGSLDDIKCKILNNKNNVLIICKIIRNYISKLDLYKKENNIYTFSDVASLSIKILKENENVRNEIKYFFKEIMIDEYQDTNDVQDVFISLIENNNVYMVGDIKQSIYKFRGSNPNIFKDKYDNYSKNNGGYKIDLINNFRSREEVLKNINDIFRLIMDNNIGGANYKESHEMVYGNKTYSELSEKDFDYNMDILEYDKSDEYTNSEIEIFAIANDIKNKISNNFKVFDKETNSLRNITYNDFVIILDRSKYFNDYKKIFEYLGIPLTILKDDKLNSSVDLLLLKNIFDFIIRINNNDFGIDFVYDFLSISRSFLYEYSDDYIFDIIKDKKYKETTIYTDLSSIESINSKTSNELLYEILNKTHFYEKIYKVGDYENTNVRLKTLYSIASNLNNMGLSIVDFKDYLDELNENDIDIRYSAYNNSSDSVKIMTIHASKGLEYPICYFADLDHKFNLSDINDMFVVSSKYGLLIPNTDEEDNILKILYKNDYIKEEIGEKIRLFYVALTRAREKIIILIPKKDTYKLEKDENGVIDEIRRLDIIKLSDIIYSIKDYLPNYFKDLDLSRINLTKNYLFNKKISTDISDINDTILVKEININNDKKSLVKHFSKESNLINKESRNNMLYGTKIHQILEYLDFKNYDSSLIEDKFIKEKIDKFMSSDLFSEINNCNIYKEYEFIYEKDNIKFHGIIDLIIEHDTYIDIIDYKLKNISDEEYLNQLHGYKDYIIGISNKDVNIYLYSILDGNIKKIE